MLGTPGRRNGDRRLFSSGTELAAITNHGRSARQLDGDRVTIWIEVPSGLRCKREAGSPMTVVGDVQAAR